MKDTDGRRQSRFRVLGAVLHRPHTATLSDHTAGGAATTGTETSDRSVVSVRSRIGTTALAFRGYDVTNSGRSVELLDRPDYGPIVAEILAEASSIASDTLHRRVDLAASLRAGEPTSLERFAEDVALIVGMEMAHVRLLETFHDLPLRDAKLSFGYSIGELAAMVFGGSFTLEQLLPIPLALADDCAALAADTSMGILFTREDVLPEEVVDRLCLSVSSEGRGMIAPSAWLSPNTALLLGQGDTLSRLERRLKDLLPQKIMLRRNPNRWPPLHTPIVWEKNVTNRAAVALYHIAGGGTPPKPPILCGVTGAASYDGINSRELLIRWVDRPQRLWDAIDATLSAGVEQVLHVGPAPNLIPATFDRLSNNVRKQLGNGYRSRMGKGLVSSMNRHAWLAHILPHKAALLRAPFLSHIIAEDWLLEQPLA